MSIQAVSWVLEHSEARGLARLVLIALANHADDRRECWPSSNALAHEARVSRATVFRALDELVALGEVEKVENGSARGRANRYRIIHNQSHRETNQSHIETPTGRNLRRGSLTGETGGSITAETQNHHLNHQEPSRANQSHDETPRCATCDGTGVTANGYVCDHDARPPLRGRSLSVVPEGAA